MKDQLNLKRLSLLVTKEFALNKKNVLIIISSMTFLSMLVTYLLPVKVYLNGTEWRYYQMFPPVVILYCIVVSAYSFIELNTADRNVEFIMLPSSTLEKYLTKFVYSTFGYVLIGIFALSITSIFAHTLNVDAPQGYDATIPFFKKDHYIILIQIYLLSHSLFFFGSVYFRKLELVKTFLALVGIIAGFYFYSMILNEILDFESVTPSFNVARNSLYLAVDSEQFLTLSSRQSLNEFLRTAGQTVTVVGLYLTPLFFWLMGYLRLKENEVTDGI